MTMLCELVSCAIIDSPVVGCGEGKRSMGDQPTEQLNIAKNASDAQYEQDEFEALATLAEDDMTESVYTGWESEQPDGFAAPPEEGAQIYGLQEKNTRDARKADAVQSGRKVPVAAIVGLAIALLGCGGLVVCRQMTAKPEPAQPAASKPVAVAPKVVEQPPAQPAVQVLGVNEIQAFITTSFQYEGEDISIDPSRLVVEVKDGRVLVTHQLNEDDVPDAARVTRMAGIRANVLGNFLVGKNVGLASTEEGMPIVDVTWVVRNANGEAFVAATEVPGEVRTSEDPYGVLKGVQGYALSADVLKALGEAAGLSETFGLAPTDLDGNAITTTAKLASKTSDSTTTEKTTATTTSSNTTSYEEEEEESHSSGTTGNGGTSQQTVTPTPTPAPAEPTPTPNPIIEPTPSTPTDGGETGGGTGEGGASQGGESGGTSEGGETTTGGGGGADA